VIATTWSLQAQSGGSYTFSSFAGAAPGRVDGTGLAVRFTRPTGVAVDAAGNTWVADSLAVRRVAPAGVVSTFAELSDVNTLTNDIALQPGSGTLYVGHPFVIFKVTSAGEVSHLADSTSSNSFFSLSGIDVDADGNVYVADTFNCAIKKVTPQGTVTSIVGPTGPTGHICPSPVDGSPTNPGSRSPVAPVPTAARLPCRSSTRTTSSPAARF